MKKVCDFCRLFMWAAIGGFIGRTISTYTFYRKNPGLLDLMSAPWCAELLVPLVITIILTIILVLVRVILTKADKK